MNKGSKLYAEVKIADMNNLLADGNKDGSQFVSPFGSEKPVEEK